MLPEPPAKYRFNDYNKNGQGACYQPGDHSNNLGR